MPLKVYGNRMEPLVTTDLYLLTCKIAFLVAITLTRCTSELSAIHYNYCCLQFYPDKISLFIDVSFLPKVLSKFHLSQPIVSSHFCVYSSRVNFTQFRHMMGPHFLCVLHSTFQEVFSPFLSYQDLSKGVQISSQYIAKCVISTILLVYQLVRSLIPSQ